MRTKNFFLFFLFISFFISLHAQIKVNNQDNNFCWEIYNPSGYKWAITTGNPDNWGHVNSLDFSNNGSTYTMQLFRDNTIGLHGRTMINFGGMLNHSKYGFCGEARNYDFDPGRRDLKGMIIENSYGEGSGFYCDDEYAVIWSPGDQNFLLKVIDEDGMQLRWYIDGAGYDYHYSDQRAKNNINKLNSNLSKLKTINGVSFNYLSDSINSERIKNANVNSNSKANIVSNAISTSDTTTFLTENNFPIINDSITKRNIKKDSHKFKPELNKYYGFLAQELEKTFPELVQTESNTGDKYVNYTGMIPVLAEAIKELDVKTDNIDKLKATNDSLLKIIDKQTKTLTNHEKRLAILEGCVKCTGKQKSAESPDISVETVNSLEQNSPNPFYKQTSIIYTIAKEVKKATIYVYDMQGKQKKSYPIATRGQGSLIIKSFEYQAGMYMYALVTDGNEVDTKKMILTE